MTTEKTHNQKIKASVTKELMAHNIEINGVMVPLLGKDSKTLLLECNDCAVSEIKPDYNIKK